MICRRVYSVHTMYTHVAVAFDETQHFLVLFAIILRQGIILHFLFHIFKLFCTFAASYYSAGVLVSCTLLLNSKYALLYFVFIQRLEYMSACVPVHKAYFTGLIYILYENLYCFLDCMKHHVYALELHSLNSSVCRSFFIFPDTFQMYSCTHTKMRFNFAGYYRSFRVKCNDSISFSEA